MLSATRMDSFPYSQTSRRRVRAPRHDGRVLRRMDKPKARLKGAARILRARIVRWQHPIAWRGSWMVRLSAPSFPSLLFVCLPVLFPDAVQRDSGWPLRHRHPCGGLRSECAGGRRCLRRDDHDRGHPAHEGLRRGEPADQGATDARQGSAGTPKQNGKMAEYLATINLSAVDKWDYELKPGRYYSVYQVISDSKNGYGWPSLSKAISAPSTPRRAR